MTQPPPEYDAWNPGIRSQLPQELLHLATIFRPENVFTSVHAAAELRGLTGLVLSEHVAFRPERLALHELLIRVSADLEVPDGSRIEDLGINFRRITRLLLAGYIEPLLPALRAVYADTRRRLEDAVGAALDTVVPAMAAAAPTTPPGWFARLLAERQSRQSSNARGRHGERGWGPVQIAELERIAGTHTAGTAFDSLQELACRTLARVMAALFKTQGHAWGTRDLLVSLTTAMAANTYCSEAIGEALDPVWRAAIAREGYCLLPRQEHPIVINTKGASASGKSTLRPLQKKLASEIGADWRQFALISPDIWRKQLLDYAALGSAYKYAGAFTADEVQIVDQKLDRYMARKHRRGEMSHLLIDRFRFDSFAPDSEEAGSNLLTRFGQMVYLFFVITPPDQLVERAWKRGLEFGRYKAVDDTLAHSVEAYSGIPDVFFTWVRRSDKQLQFEFLDNTVCFGEPPRTVAFGDNATFNLLNMTCLFNIQRYGRIDVNAADPASLYKDPTQLSPERNTEFLKRCMQEFRYLNFADQASGRIYLRVESGDVAWVDRAPLDAALADPDTLAGVTAAVPLALNPEARQIPAPQYLDALKLPPTLGQWGARMSPLF